MSVRTLRYNTATQHFTKSALASTDRDALAFLEAAQIYNTNQQRAIVNLVRSLKRVGLWSKMKAIYPFVGGTATSHKWNLKDPRDVDAAFRLSFQGGWTHSSNGATGNGSNAYANTFFKASEAGMALYDGHLSYYNRNATAPTKTECYMGVGSNTPSWNGKELWMIWHDQATNPDTIIAMQHVSTGTFGNSYGAAYATNDRLGLWMESRTSSNATSLKLFRNGTAVANATNTVTGQAVNTQPVYINAWFQYTISAPYAANFSINQCAFATIGDGLTDTDATNLYTIVDLFQKRLGRAV